MYEGRLLAVAHLHFVDARDDVLEILSRLPIAADVIVTYTSEAGDPEVLRQRIPNAEIRLVENRGRDIRPFLEVMQSVELADYTTVLKVHGKKSSQLPDGDDWRRSLLTGLVPDAESAHRVMMAFACNPSLGLVAPQEALRTEWAAGVNRPAMRDVAGQAGIIRLPKTYLFPAGTMFWANPAALAWLQDVDPTMFSLDASPIFDGCPEHAVERLIGAVAVGQGYRVLSMEGLPRLKNC